MKNTTTLISIMLLGAACGGSQQTYEDPQTVQMRDQVERTEAERAPRPRAEGTQLDDEEPPPMPPEELAVEMYELNPNETTTTEDGLSVKMIAGAPNWRFEISNGTETTTAADDGAPLYIEGVAFGRLFVFSKFGDATQVTLRSDVPERPFTPAEATALASQERQTRLGCDAGRENVDVQSNGTVVVTVQNDSGGVACEIVVGRYTRSIVDI